MTKFCCTTCCEVFDDEEIKWWNNSQVCSRCLENYQKVVLIDKSKND